MLLVELSSRWNNIFLSDSFNMHIGCSKEPSYLDDFSEYVYITRFV